MNEVLYEENIADRQVAEREIKPAYPHEHVCKVNEKTYFHRPAGLF